MNRIILILSLLVLLSGNTKAQFGLEASISDTAICLGECIDLWSTYDTAYSLMANDFNDGTLGDGWSSNANPTVSSSICGPGPDGTPYAWVGSASSFPRDLVTVSFTIIDGCRICFDFRMAVQGDDSPCEGPDEMDEGVSLQWSNDGGSTWHDITYFCPDGNQYPSNQWVGQSTSGTSGPTYFTDWHNYCFDVPDAAIGNNTQFRWHQEQVTDNDYDHWGVDNVYIYCPTEQPSIVWNDGTQDFWHDTVPPQQCPQQDMTYTVTVYTSDASQDTSLHVTVYDPPYADAGPDDEICGPDYTLQGNTPSEGVGTWSSTESGVSFSDVNDPNAVVTVTTYGAHTFYWTIVNGVCDATDSVTIVFDEPPQPDAGEDVEVCGQSFTLNATPSVGTGVWSVNPSYNIHIHDIHSPVTDVDAYSYDEFVFTWKETNGLCVDSDQVTVRFKLIPNSPFTVDSLMCYQDVINVAYQGNADASANYHWDFDGANIVSGSGQGPYAVNWNSPGYYNISLWVEQEGCNSDTSTVTVYNPPELQGTLQSNDVMCYGGYDGYITSNIYGGVTPYSYLWNTGASDSVLYGIPAGNYSLTVTDAHGCQISMSAIINQPDRLDVSLPTYVDLCNGQDTTLVPAVVGGTPPYDYYWNGTYNSLTASLSPTEDTTLYVVVVDAHGCRDSAYTTVDVSPPLIMDLYTSRDSVCRGDKVVLNASFWQGAGGPYYIYGQEGNIITFPYITRIWQDTTIIIYARDVCGSLASDTVTISVYPMPYVQFIADTISGCQPLAVNFNVIAGADEISSYIWNFGDNDNENLSLGPNPSHVYNDYGVFTVTLMYTTNKGCKDTVSVPEMITVYKKPGAKFITKPELVTVIDPVVDFINMSSDNVLNFWSFGDGDSSIQVNPRHSYPNVINNYEVVLIVESDKGCRDTAVAIVPVKDVDAFYAPTAFTPDNDGVNEIFHVVIRNIDTSKPFRLSIYDRWGELVWQTDKYDPENPARYGWDGTVKNGAKKAPPDVYVWYCEYSTLNNNDKQQSGHVLLIR